ncbi:hypothetical protein PSACC_01475 [Paramicrosporidium saccamoebae]|uniref:5'-3' exoribonuclease n=1 Tax=Paramicrosporidium saccamoebae TaxID=1246581 RepID=A0A2H9TLS1_9FUNG|nr:hypothetical protein PSACC_01475 [Paramicrosporidium saccamoebae]
MGVPALFRWLSSKYPKTVGNVAAPETEEEMMVEIFKYIDRIFAMIRPRKLLFMAIDGVAPRAKMNQQRSRRFRAAKERRDKTEKDAEIRSELGTEAEDSGDYFDYNCITPGTKFMALIASSIKYYIVERMNREPAWRNVKVIFSDANVPGEGEHKIMDYIRRQRLDPDYDPHTKHVIYGLDADLIMLSMATHEPYFKVLREDVFSEEQVKYTPCGHCGVKGHAADSCVERAKNDPTFTMAPIKEKPFIFLDVSILREYLEAELKPSTQLPFKWDLERAIDDWIFMCFFVGNDFLPHLPCLEIREGAIDILLDSYKANLPRMGGFICHNGTVELSRAQYILDDVGKVEEMIFQKRREKEERRDANIKRRKMADAEREMVHSQTPTPPSGEFANGNALLEMRDANRVAAQAFKTHLEASLQDDEPVDDVRLWERGCKGRYYRSKFHIEPDNQEFIAQVVKSYVEGLCWVMAYYYQGCPSWKWFYPYHFAPFASDLTGIGELDISFELGEPFRPFDQLMGVFPADSRMLVPEPFRRLMTEDDSEVIDFYPTDFAIDLNGKKQAWQGVVLLPFIDEERLLGALEKVYPELDPTDQQMNIRGEDRVFFSIWHPVTRHLVKRLEEGKHSASLDPAETDGLAGGVMKDADFPGLGSTYSTPLPEQGCVDVEDVQVACFVYFVPYHDRKHLRHKATLLPEAQPPSRILTPEDISAVQSGMASRRMPGRLQLERPGHHSMHQEHGRDYERRDSGRKREYQSDGQRRGNGGQWEGYQQRGQGRQGGQRGYQQEYQRDSYQRDSHQQDSYQRDSYQQEAYQRDSHQQDSYQRNPYQQPPQRDSHHQGDSRPYDSQHYQPHQPHQPHQSYQQGQYPFAAPQGNPFHVLSGPPRPMQPSMGAFHRGPPPNRRVEDLYGRYPPPPSNPNSRE